MELDRAHLAKIIAMTTSTNDNEALSAVRKANEYLAACQISWADVLREDLLNTVNITLARAPPPASAYAQEDGWMPPHLNDKTVIEMMFRAVYSVPRGDNEEFWQWLDSIHQRFQEYGNLTPAQYTSLRRSYNRVLRTSSK